jgi:hypothetical protein
MATDYRIDFTIQRRTDGAADFTDIGFGSSAGCGAVNDAAAEVDSIVQNRMWETSKGMPCPDSVDRYDDA